MQTTPPGRVLVSKETAGEYELVAWTDERKHGFDIDLFYVLIYQLMDRRKRCMYKCIYSSIHL